MVVEPPYSAERPERRRLRYVQDMLQQKAVWEAATHELAAEPTGTQEGAPRGWQRDDQPPAVSIRLPRVSGPFRYRTRAAGLVAPPLDVRCSLLPAEAAGDWWMETTAIPRLEGTGVAFLLPWGVTPAEANLAGTVVDGRWRAVVVPAPADGIMLRVRLPQEAVSLLTDGRVLAIVHGAPGGVGWQRLPPWLPRETFSWTVQSFFVMPWPVPLM
jgi:hypothetical protein